jgi:hypothetical protein
MIESTSGKSWRRCGQVARGGGSAGGCGGAARHGSVARAAQSHTRAYGSRGGAVRVAGSSAERVTAEGVERAGQFRAEPASRRRWPASAPGRQQQTGPPQCPHAGASWSVRTPARGATRRTGIRVAVRTRAMRGSSLGTQATPAAGGCARRADSAGLTPSPATARRPTSAASVRRAARSRMAAGAAPAPGGVRGSRRVPMLRAQYQRGRCGAGRPVRRRDRRGGGAGGCGSGWR